MCHAQGASRRCRTQGAETPDALKAGALLLKLVRRAAAAPPPLASLRDWRAESPPAAAAPQGPSLSEATSSGGPSEPRRLLAPLSPPTTSATSCGTSPPLALIGRSSSSDGSWASTSCSGEPCGQPCASVGPPTQQQQQLQPERRLLLGLLQQALGRQQEAAAAGQLQLPTQLPPAPQAPEQVLPMQAAPPQQLLPAGYSLPAEAAARSLPSVSMEVRSALRLAASGASPDAARHLRQRVLEELREAAEASRACGRPFAVAAALHVMLPRLWAAAAQAAERPSPAAGAAGVGATLATPSHHDVSRAHGASWPVPQEAAHSSSPCPHGSCPAPTSRANRPVPLPPVPLFSDSAPRERAAAYGRTEAGASATVGAGEAPLLAAAAVESALSAAALEAQLCCPVDGGAAAWLGAPRLAAGPARPAGRLDVDAILQSELAVALAELQR